jgi:hypothetical protein
MQASINGEPMDVQIQGQRITFVLLDQGQLAAL